MDKLFCILAETINRDDLFLAAMQKAEVNADTINSLLSENRITEALERLACIPTLKDAPLVQVDERLARAFQVIWGTKPSPTHHSVRGPKKNT